jgi:hypothetical protein
MRKTGEAENMLVLLELDTMLVVARCRWRVLWCQHCNHFLHRPHVTKYVCFHKEILEII